MKGDDDRLAITNQALRELSGVNGLVVGDWIKAHAVVANDLIRGSKNQKPVRSFLRPDR